MNYSTSDMSGSSFKEEPDSLFLFSSLLHSFFLFLSILVI